VVGPNAKAGINILIDAEERRLKVQTGVVIQVVSAVNDEN